MCWERPLTDFEMVEPGQWAGKDDKVNRPSHYTSGGIETIDFIRAKLTDEQWEGYLVGNIMKYISRYRHKNGVEDLKKAQWYLNRLIEHKEFDSDKGGK